MRYLSVEKLATLCRVDRETIRRWRNRGVNGIKLEAAQSESQRGAALMFSEDAVRTFMNANQKYITRDLDDFFREESNGQSGAAKVDRNFAEDSYVRQILEQQRLELSQKLREVELALEQYK